MKRPVLLLAGFVAAALVAAACSGGASGYGIVYDGKTTTQATIDRELRAIADNEKFAQALSQSSSGTKLTNTNGSINSDISAAWVNALVQYQAYDAAVKKDGIEVTAADRDAAKTQADQLFGGPEVFAAFPTWFRDRQLDRDASKVAYLRTNTKSPTDAEARAFFEQNKAQLCPSGKLVSHILVATQEAADAIETQLAAGADFATVAKASSTDTQSGAQGGLLGCLGAQQYVAEFEAAADGLPIGEISPPVKTQFGFHVISVAPLTYEVAKSSVENQLQQQESIRINALVGKRVEKAGLKVNPRYGKVQRGADGVKVVPPAKPKVRNEPSTSTSTPSLSVPGTPTPSSSTPGG